MTLKVVLFTTKTTTTIKFYVKVRCIIIYFKLICIEGNYNLFIRKFSLLSFHNFVSEMLLHNICMHSCCMLVLMPIEYSNRKYFFLLLSWINNSRGLLISILQIVIPKKVKNPVLYADDADQ